MQTAVTPINYPGVQNLMLADLPAQFADKPRFQALFKALAKGEQELEDLAAALTFWRNLVDCVGTQLDGWGQIVGELRAGRSDADYRLGIIAKIYRNCSCGEPNRMMEALKALTGADSTLYVFDPDYPATFTMFYMGTFNPTNFTAILEDIAPLGVEVSYSYGGA
jgi:hypothetical protein